jgi:hypothetical protein
MESKSEEAYISFFEYLRDVLAVNFQPNEGYTDFEAALMNALISVYSNFEMRITGCWFHFAKVAFLFHFK